MIKEDVAAKLLASRGIDYILANFCRREDSSLLLLLLIPSFIAIPLIRPVLAFLYPLSCYLIIIYFPLLQPAPQGG